MPRQETVRDLLRGARPVRLQVAPLVLSVVAAVAVVGAFLLLAALVGRDFKFFSKEPVETLGGPAYVGWFAHLGALVWWSGAVVALFTGAVLRLRQQGRGLLLLALGAYSAVLVADDLFLLHEAVYPVVGLPEEVVYATYGLLALLLLWRFAAEVLAHDALLFAAALGFWVGSVGFDAVQEAFEIHLHVLEDGAKLVGVVLWAVFLLRASARELTEQPSPGPPAPSRSASSAS